MKNVPFLQKKALAGPADSSSHIPYVKEMEEELLNKINKLGIGPGGLGGTRDCTGSKYRNLSYTYCRSACSSQYMLSRKQTREQNIIIKVNKIEMIYRYHKI